jgi:hypothetical protein
MLYCATLNSPAPCPTAAPARCPHCGDWMVAPIVSEFVEDGEIRHHWECESCGERAVGTVQLALD